MGLKFRYKLLNIFIRMIASTWQYKIIGKVPEKNSIIVFWHGLMLPVWKYFSEKKAIAVVSVSKDGEILASLLKKWHYSLVRGSSGIGGKVVMNEITELSRNNLVLITPDGPKGPVYKFKPGAVVAAHRSGSAIVLCNVGIKGKFSSKKSWDNFSIPTPFAKIELHFSDEIFVPAESEKDGIDIIIKNLEQQLKINNF
ncbi:MAG: DUF374 domain-containing protein [FCB group bacterium]|jgi:lysophospholipid acyltransferase (LPLAT)-like uncharacterized protein